MIKNKTGDNRMALQSLLVVVSISFLQLSSVAIAQSIVEIKTFFSSASVTLIQVMYTLPSVFMALSALTIPYLRRVLSDKMIITFSMLLIIIAGIMTLLLHNRIYLMYCYSIILGIGVGPIMPISSTLASQQFESENRSRVLNMQMASSSAGGIIICLVSGILVVKDWYNYGYIFLLAIPVLVICNLYWPKDRQEAEPNQQINNSSKNNFITILFCIIGFCFGISYFTFTANIALHLSNIGLGNSSLAGVFCSVLLCGGILGAAFSLKISSKYDMVLIQVGLCALGVGIYVFSHSTYWPVLAISCVVGGLSNSIVISRSLNMLAKSTSQSLRSTRFSIFTVSFQTGAFLSAIIINGIANIRGHNTVAERCLIACIISFLMVILLGSYIEYNNMKKDY